MIKLIILYALTAGIFPLNKLLIAAGALIFFTGIRMVLGGALILIYVWATGRLDTTIFRSRYWWPLLQLTVCNVFLTNILQIWATQFVDTGTACFLYNFAPFFAALFSFWLFNERITIRKLLGLIIGFAAFIPLVLTTQSVSAFDLPSPGYFIPEIALLIAAAASVWGWIVMKQLVHLSNGLLITANGLTMILGGLLCFPFSLALEAWKPVPIFQFWPFVGCVIGMIILSNIIGYNAYTFLLRQYSPTFLTFTSFMSPFFAAAYGYLLFGEPITWHLFVAAIAVVTGLSLYYYDEIRLKEIKKDLLN